MSEHKDQLLTQDPEAMRLPSYPAGFRLECFAARGGSDRAALRRVRLNNRFLTTRFGEGVSNESTGPPPSHCRSAATRLVFLPVEMPNTRLAARA